MGKVLGILSLKGGVGKTSSTVALGAALSELGKKVLLVDANLSSPNLGIHLNLLNPEKSLHEVLAGKANAKDAIYKHGDFDVLPSSLFGRHVRNPLKLRDKLKNIKRKYDYIIIDSSPALNNETLAAMLASDDLFVITTPDYATLGSTLKAVKMAKQRKTPVTGLILNKVYNKNFEINLENIEEVSGVPVMAVVPHDLNILKAQSKFTPSTSFKPNSDGSVEYKKLAATITGDKYKTFRWKNILKIKPEKQDINREIYYESIFN